MILQYIFSMATNLFATLLLFCDAFQTSLSLRYRFFLCASRFFVALFWDGGGVKGWGRVQHAWARLPGSDIIDHYWSRHCHWAVSFRYTVTSGGWSVTYRLPDCIVRNVDSIPIKFIVNKWGVNRMVRLQQPSTFLLTHKCNQKYITGT